VHLLLLFGYVATGISGNVGCVAIVTIAIVTIATPTVLLVLWPATLHGVARTLHCVATEENLLQHQNKVLCKPIATASVATPPNQIFVLQFCLLQHFLAYCNTFRPLHQGENHVVTPSWSSSDRYLHPNALHGATGDGFTMPVIISTRGIGRT
jgi:hypothetical protein